MKIHHEFVEHADVKRNVLTIGTFDGVHKAHRELIQQVVEQSRVLGCQSALLTFHPHPRSVIYPEDRSLLLLNDLDEKIERLAETGLDHLIIYPFTVEFSQLHPKEYMESFLLKNFDPVGLVVGFDHQFGLNRQGDIRLMEEYASKNHFSITQVSKQESNHIKISSSQIRHFILEGNIREANDLLGYRYSLYGQVIKGDNLGTELGYPTANLQLRDSRKLIPAAGIYAAFVKVDGVQYEGLLYIGSKPSFQEVDKIFIEVNLRNFDGSLYNDQICIELVEFIRPDQKFESLEDLKSQMMMDENKIAGILKEEQARSN